MSEESATMPWHNTPASPLTGHDDAAGEESRTSSPPPSTIDRLRFKPDDSWVRVRLADANYHYVRAEFDQMNHALRLVDAMMRWLELEARL